MNRHNIIKIAAVVTLVVFTMNTVVQDYALALQPELRLKREDFKSAFEIKYAVEQARSIIELIEERGAVAPRTLQDIKAWMRSSEREFENAVFEIGNEEILIKIDNGNIIIRYFNPGRSQGQPKGTISAAYWQMDAKLNNNLARQLLYTDKLQESVIAQAHAIGAADLAAREAPKETAEGAMREAGAPITDLSDPKKLRVGDVVELNEERFRITGDFAPEYPEVRKAVNISSGVEVVVKKAKGHEAENAPMVMHENIVGGMILKDSKGNNVLISRLVKGMKIEDYMLSLRERQDMTDREKLQAFRQIIADIMNIFDYFRMSGFYYMDAKSEHFIFDEEKERIVLIDLKLLTKSSNKQEERIKAASYVLHIIKNAGIMLGVPFPDYISVIFSEENVENRFESLMDLESDIDIAMASWIRDVERPAGARAALDQRLAQRYMDELKGIYIATATMPSPQLTGQMARTTDRDDYYRVMAMLDQLAPAQKGQLQKWSRSWVNRILFSRITSLVEEDLRVLAEEDTSFEGEVGGEDTGPKSPVAWAGTAVAALGALALGVMPFVLPHIWTALALPVIDKIVILTLTIPVFAWLAGLSAKLLAYKNTIISKEGLIERSRRGALIDRFNNAQQAGYAFDVSKHLWLLGAIENSMQQIDEPELATREGRVAFVREIFANPSEFRELAGWVIRNEQAIRKDIPAIAAEDDIGAMLEFIRGNYDVIADMRDHGLVSEARNNNIYFIGNAISRFSKISQELLFRHESAHRFILGKSPNAIVRELPAYLNMVITPLFFGASYVLLRFVGIVPNEALLLFSITSASLVAAFGRVNRVTAGTGLLATAASIGTVLLAASSGYITVSQGLTMFKAIAFAAAGLTAVVPVVFKITRAIIKNRSAKTRPSARRLQRVEQADQTGPIMSRRDFLKLVGALMGAYTVGRQAQSVNDALTNVRRRQLLDALQAHREQVIEKTVEDMYKNFTLMNGRNDPDREFIEGPWSVTGADGTFELEDGYGSHSYLNDMETATKLLLEMSGLKGMLEYAGMDAQELATLQGRPLVVRVLSVFAMIPESESARLDDESLVKKYQETLNKIRDGQWRRLKQDFLDLAAGMEDKEAERKKADKVKKLIRQALVNLPAKSPSQTIAIISDRTTKAYAEKNKSEYTQSQLQAARNQLDFERCMESIRQKVAEELGEVVDIPTFEAVVLAKMSSSIGTVGYNKLDFDPSGPYVGLMQLSDAPAKEGWVDVLGQDWGSYDPYNPNINIKTGSAYMAWLMRRIHGVISRGLREQYPTESERQIAVRIPQEDIIRYTIAAYNLGISYVLGYHDGKIDIKGILEVSKEQGGDWTNFDTAFTRAIAELEKTPVENGTKILKYRFGRAYAYRATRFRRLFSATDAYQPAMKQIASLEEKAKKAADLDEIAKVAAEVDKAGIRMAEDRRGTLSLAPGIFSGIGYAALTGAVALAVASSPDNKGEPAEGAMREEDIEGVMREGEERTRELFAEYGQGDITDMRALEESLTRSEPWLIETADSQYVLIRSVARNRPELIRWESSLMSGLRERGFTRSPRIYKTVAGQSYVERDGEYYVLYEYKPGKQMPWGSITDIKLENTAKTQAQYHDAVADLEPEGENIQNSQRLYPLADLSDGLPMRNWLHKARDAIPDSVPERYRDALKLLQSRIDLFERQLDTIEQLAPPGGYMMLPHLIIHGDFNPNNLLFTGDDISGQIDFDYARKTPRILDLANGAINISWADDSAGFEDLIRYLEIYQENVKNKLTADEIKYLPQAYRAWMLEGVSLVTYWIMQADDPRISPELIISFINGAANNLRALDNSLDRGDWEPVSAALTPEGSMREEGGAVAAVLDEAGSAEGLFVLRDPDEFRDIIKLRKTKRASTEVAFDRMLERMRRNVEAGLDYYRAHFGQMDPQAYRLKREDIGIYQNMRELSALRDHRVQLSVASTGNTLAVALALYQERLHLNLTDIYQKDATDRFAEDVFVAYKVVEYLLNEDVTPRERTGYLGYLRDANSVNHTNFLNLVKEFEAVKKTATPGTDVRDALIRVVARYVKKANARDLPGQMKGPQFDLRRTEVRQSIIRGFDASQRLLNEYTKQAQAERSKNINAALNALARQDISLEQARGALSVLKFENAMAEDITRAEEAVKSLERLASIADANSTIAEEGVALEKAQEALDILITRNAAPDDISRAASIVKRLEKLRGKETRLAERKFVRPSSYFAQRLRKGVMAVVIFIIMSWSMWADALTNAAVDNYATRVVSGQTTIETVVDQNPYGLGYEILDEVMTRTIPDLAAEKGLQPEDIQLMEEDKVMTEAASVSERQKAVKESVWEMPTIEKAVPLEAEIADDSIDICIQKGRVAELVGRVMSPDTPVADARVITDKLAAAGKAAPSAENTQTASSLYQSMLLNENPDLRRVACRYFAHAGITDPAVVSAIAGRLENDPNTRVAKSSFFTLARIDSENIPQYMSTALQRADMEGVGLKYFASLPADSVVKIAIDELTQSENAEVRFVLAQKLSEYTLSGEIRPDVLAALEQLTHDSNTEISSVAKDSVGIVKSLLHFGLDIYEYKEEGKQTGYRFVTNDGMHLATLTCMRDADIGEMLVKYVMPTDQGEPEAVALLPADGIRSLEGQGVKIGALSEDEAKSVRQGLRDAVQKVFFRYGIPAGLVDMSLVDSVQDKVTSFIQGKDISGKGVTGEFHAGDWGLNTLVSKPHSSGFGMRLHPVLNVVKMHTGIDFGIAAGMTAGQPIKAVGDGIVEYAGWMGGYGNLVIIDHGTVDGNKLTTYYAHASEILVSVGQNVSVGDVVSKVGDTGLGTGAHLHFETRINGNPTDPAGLEGGYPAYYALLESSGVKKGDPSTVSPSQYLSLLAQNIEKVPDERLPDFVVMARTQTAQVDHGAEGAMREGGMEEEAGTVAEIGSLLEDYRQSGDSTRTRDAKILEEVAPLIMRSHRLISPGNIDEFRRILSSVCDGTADVSELYGWMKQNTPMRYISIADEWSPAEKTETGDGVWGPLQKPENRLPGSINRDTHIAQMISAAQAIIRQDYEVLYRGSYQGYFGTAADNARPDLVAGSLEMQLSGFLEGTIDIRELQEALYLAIVLHDYGRILKDRVKLNPADTGPDAAQHRIAGAKLADDLLSNLGVSEFQREIVSLIIRLHDAPWNLYSLAKYGQYNNFTTPESVEEQITSTALRLRDRGLIPAGLSVQELERSLIRMVAVIGIADVHAAGDRYVSDNLVTHTSLVISSFDERSGPEGAMLEEESGARDIQRIHGFHARELVERADLPRTIRSALVGILTSITARLQPGAILNLVRIASIGLFSPILGLLHHFRNILGIDRIIRRLTLTRDRVADQWQTFRGIVRELVHARFLEMNGFEVVEFNPEREPGVEFGDIVLRRLEDGQIIIAQVQSGAQLARNEEAVRTWLVQQLGEHEISVQLPVSGAVGPYRSSQDMLGAQGESIARSQARVVFTYSTRAGDDIKRLETGIRETCKSFIEGKRAPEEVLVVPVGYDIEEFFAPEIIDNSINEISGQARAVDAVNEQLNTEVDNEIQRLRQTLRLEIPQELVRGLYDVFGFTDQGRRLAEELIRSMNESDRDNLLALVRDLRQQLGASRDPAQREQLVAKAVDVLVPGEYKEPPKYGRPEGAMREGEHISAEGPLKAGMFYVMDEGGEISTGELDGGAWSVNRGTESRLYVGHQARNHLLSDPAFGAETQIYNALGNRISFTVDGERFVLDRQGVIILQDVRAAGMIRFEEADGADVVVSIEKEPAGFKRFSHPDFQWARDSLGFDSSGLMSPESMASKGIRVFALSEKKNLWTKQSSPWFSSSVVVNAPLLGASLIQGSGEGRSDAEKKAVNFYELFGEETIHLHPVVDNAAMHELYICIEGTMGLLTKAGGQERLIILKPGDVFVAAPNIAHGISQVNLPYRHVVVQVPSTFHYGYAFKNMVQTMPDFISTTPYRANIEQLMRKDEQGVFSIDKPDTWYARKGIPEGAMREGGLTEAQCLLPDDIEAQVIFDIVSQDVSLRNVYSAVKHFLEQQIKGASKVLKRGINRAGRHQEEFLGELVEAKSLEDNVKYSRVIELSMEDYGPEIDCVLEVDRAKYADNSEGKSELEDGIYLVESKTQSHSDNLEVVIELTQEDKTKKYEAVASKMRAAGTKNVRGIIFAIGGDIIPAHGIESFRLAQEERDTALGLLSMDVFVAFVPDIVIERGELGLTPKEEAFVSDLIADLRGTGKIDEADEAKSAQILQAAVAEKGIDGVRFAIMGALKSAGVISASRKNQPKQAWDKVFAGLAESGESRQPEGAMREEALRINTVTLDRLPAYSPQMDDNALYENYQNHVRRGELRGLLDLYMDRLQGAINSIPIGKIQDVIRPRITVGTQMHSEIDTEILRKLLWQQARRVANGADTLTIREFDIMEDRVVKIKNKRGFQRESMDQEKELDAFARQLAGLGYVVERISDQRWPIDHYMVINGEIFVRSEREAPGESAAEGGNMLYAPKDRFMLISDSVNDRSRLRLKNDLKGQVKLFELPSGYVRLHLDGQDDIPAQMLSHIDLSIGIIESAKILLVDPVYLHRPDVNQKIRAIAEAEGYRIVEVDEHEAYLHPTNMLVLPDGRIIMEKAPRTILRIQEAVTAMQRDGILPKELKLDMTQLERSFSANILNYGSIRCASNTYHPIAAELLGSGLTNSEVGAFISLLQSNRNEVTVNEAGELSISDRGRAILANELMLKLAKRTPGYQIPGEISAAAADGFRQLGLEKYAARVTEVPIAEREIEIAGAIEGKGAMTDEEGPEVVYEEVSGPARDIQIAQNAKAQELANTIKQAYKQLDGKYAVVGVQLMNGLTEDNPVMQYLTGLEGPVRFVAAQTPGSLQSKISQKKSELITRGINPADITVPVIVSAKGQRRFDGVADFITAVTDDQQPVNAVMPILDLINMTINISVLGRQKEARELYKSITGKDPEEGDLTLKSIIITLPDATRIETDDLRKIYEGARAFLEAA